MRELRKALVILLLFALCAFFGYELFQVRNIYVSGASRYPLSDVVSLASSAYGQSMFLLDEDALKAVVEKDPRFILGRIIYQWPGGITLSITERYPAAYIVYGNAFAVIDKDGYVLTIQSNAPDALPEISGFNVATLKIGQAVTSTQSEQVAAFSAVLSALEEYSWTQNIASIELWNTLSIKMKAVSGMTIKLGPYSDMNNKISWLPSVMPELKARYSDEQIARGSLDVSSGKSAVYNETGD